MNNNSSKQILLSVIGVAILVVAVVGVSFAFFSYVYNSDKTNTVATGTIVFKASDSQLKLTNIFPTDSVSSGVVHNEDVLKATVSVSGKTTYENGIYYEVRATDVENAEVTVDGKNVTITPRISVTAFPQEDVVTVELTNNGTYNKSNPLENEILATGTITGGPDAAGLATDTRILEIQAYYSKDDYHISDTSTADELIAAKLLPTGWAGEVLSTNQWNALSDSRNAYSFKIQVTAVEGGQSIPRFPGE